MKKLVRIIDENGFFIRDDFVEELNDSTIETPCPQGFYRPKWDGDKWIEGGVKPEKQEKQESEKPPTQKERLEALEKAMLELILGGISDD